MDGEFLGDLPSDTKGDVEASPFSYTKAFEQMFPFYLSIGMTAEQYWEGEPSLTVFYRKAEEIRIERKNQELWLQGLYIYESLCNVSPILHAFAKEGSKPIPYPSEPYPITERQLKQREEENRIAEMENQKKKLQAMAVILNHQIEEVRKDGRTND